MILFFCGAPKHGSHFQMFVVQEALEQRGIPFQQVGNAIFHTHDLRAGVALLNELESRENEIFICKGHWGAKRERDLLLKYATVRVFLIWRDLRDVLVSQYYYDINKSGIRHRDFETFYWRSGRFLLREHLRYRRVWDEVGDDTRIVHTEFRALRERFREEAEGLLRFAEVEGVDLRDLEERLRLERLREKHHDPGGAFFRKGVVGEYAEVIRSKEVLQDIAAIEAQVVGGFPQVLRHEWRAIKSCPDKVGFAVSAMKYMVRRTGIPAWMRKVVRS